MQIIRLMGKIDETKRKNARQLVKSAGGPAKFARMTGLTDSRVSQITGDNFTRNIGKKTAELIETSFDKTEGWLSLDHDYGEIQKSYAVNERQERPSSTVNLVYLTNEELEIITAFREADQQGKDLIHTSKKLAVKDEKKLRDILKPKSSI